MKKIHIYFNTIRLILILCFFKNPLLSQTNINGFTQQSYENRANSYNFTYWDASFKTAVSSRKFTNQTSSYNLNIDYNNLNINSLDINSSNSVIA